MSWGKWIIVAFILFGGFIATLVTVCMRQDISLVSKDYYKEELAYQQQIKRLNNTMQLERKPVVQILDNRYLQIDFDQSEKIEGGELTLFCPSNAKMDKHFSLQASEKAVQVFELTGLKHGMYKARLQWTMEGKEYFLEKIVNI